MTRPRKELVSIQDTPYYHVVYPGVFGAATSVERIVRPAEAISTGASGSRIGSEFYPRYLRSTSAPTR